jgi:transposase
MDTIDDVGVGGSRLMANGAAEVRRRRRWTRLEKQRLVAETLAPGASVSLIARRHDVNANLLFTWRQQARRGTLNGRPLVAAVDESLPLIPITVTSDAADRPPPAAGDDRRGIIEIALPSGERLRVDAWVDEPALRRVLAAIRRPS